MSMYYKEHGEYWYPPTEGRTRAKQAFKDECDVNRIVQKLAKGQVVRGFNADQGRYGDFTDWPDLLTAQQRLNQGRELFEKMPAEVRREFGNNPGSFFSWVNDPANAETAMEKLKEWTQPGRQRPNPVVRKEAGSPTGADPVPAPSAPAGNGDSSSGAA